MNEFEKAFEAITEGVNERESHEYMVAQFSPKHNTFRAVDKHYAFELAQKQANELCDEGPVARVYQRSEESDKYDKIVWTHINDTDETLGDLSGAYQVFWYDRREQKWVPGAKRHDEDYAIDVGMALNKNSYDVRVYHMGGTKKELVWKS